MGLVRRSRSRSRSRAHTTRSDRRAHTHRFLLIRRKEHFLIILRAESRRHKPEPQRETLKPTGKANVWSAVTHTHLVPHEGAELPNNCKRFHQVGVEKLIKLGNIQTEELQENQPPLLGDRSKLLRSNKSRYSTSVLVHVLRTTGAKSIDNINPSRVSVAPIPSFMLPHGHGERGQAQQAARETLRVL